jgi:Flp pilus assembly protein TadD
MEIAERRTENASRLYESAWLTIARPVAKPEENRLALRRLEAACRVAVEDPARYSEYRRALALAHFRVDQPARALEIIDELARQDPGHAPWPSDLAVTAMAGGRLGRVEEAHRALEQLRKLVASGKSVGNQDAAGFLEEAEEALETAPRP